MTEWLLLALALTAYPPLSPVVPDERAERVQWDEDDAADDFDMPEGDFELPPGDDEEARPPKKDGGKKDGGKKDGGKKDGGRKDGGKKGKTPAKPKSDDDLFVDDDDDDILAPIDDEPPAKEASTDPWGTGSEPSPDEEAPRARRLTGGEPDPAPDDGGRRLIAGDDEPPAPKQTEKPRRALLEEKSRPLEETHELRLDAEQPESESEGIDPLLISAIAGGGGLIVVGLLVGAAAAVVVTGPPVLGLWALPEGFVLPWLNGPASGTITVEPQ